ncbi:MAG: hypothetical protein QNK19_13800 [Xanthomonadales bacterium]|nr:hypothetical protein [Xanthomonadales bacterium]
MADEALSPDRTRRQMSGSLSLREYVKRRNGLPLGASGSLSSNLYRSFGSGSFARFWQIWNPIWGYCLGRFVFAPLKRYFPSEVALLMTFTISGALHDLVIMAVRWKSIFFFTHWFFLMGLTVVISKRFDLNYQKLSWSGRASINFGLIAGNLILAIIIQKYYAG